MKPKTHRLSLLLLLVLMLLFSSCEASEGLRGRVTAITDGDTVKVLINNKEERVRLSGIDCPEKKQAYGTKAKEFASDMVFGKDVRLESDGLDRYGRILGWIYLDDGTCLNDELLKNGLAWHYKDYNDDPRLAMLELQARNAKIGLWQDKNPIPPWEFRKRKR